jgi:hypothetical protein
VASAVSHPRTSHEIHSADQIVNGKSDCYVIARKVQQAVNEIPDSNFRIALGSADRTKPRDRAMVWPRHVMSGLLCLVLAGLAVDAVLHYFGVILWSL